MVKKKSRKKARPSPLARQIMGIIVFLLLIVGIFGMLYFIRPDGTSTSTTIATLTNTTNETNETNNERNPLSPLQTVLCIHNMEYNQTNTTLGNTTCWLRTEGDKEFCTCVEPFK